ncbi:hypothetical protein HNR68_004815 [Saccharopolyspora hordei]|uniref:Uncharacterized protein n=1 Tax=Saccharopolyspora hordei TaxID=1838 RepID=A0A853AU61_9PSEU|nr:hypothetical protein [Saccharopolyspora hordei]
MQHGSAFRRHTHHAPILSSPPTGVQNVRTGAA